MNSSSVLRALGVLQNAPQTFKLPNLHQGPLPITSKPASDVVELQGA
jgi:hypothetical protein